MVTEPEALDRIALDRWHWTDGTGPEPSGGGPGVVPARDAEEVDGQVSSDLRRAAVEALGALGRSDDWRDRADAGAGLAGFAEMPEALGPLLELLLDRGDTFVTRHTARSLLRRRDRAGLSVVASALAVAGPDHGDWIHTAAVDVFGVFAADHAEALRLCEELAREADERTALGARRLRESLAEIDPSTG